MRIFKVERSVYRVGLYGELFYVIFPSFRSLRSALPKSHYTCDVAILVLYKNAQVLQIDVV